MPDNSAPDPDRADGSPTGRLHQLGREHQPDVSLFLTRIETGPHVRGFRMPRLGAPGQARLATFASAAAVLLVAGGVLLTMATRGPEVTPAGQADGVTGTAASSPAATPPPDIPTSPTTTGVLSTPVSTRLPTASPSSPPPSTPPMTDPEPQATTSTSAAATPGGAIRGDRSGRCLDVVEEGTADRTPVQLWDCTGRPNQSWSLTRNGTLTLYGGTKCLAVDPGAVADGTVVGIDTCNGEPNQQWTLRSRGDIVGTESGKCLDASRYGTGNGTRIQIWSCYGGYNQRWSRS